MENQDRPVQLGYYSRTLDESVGRAIYKDAAGNEIHISFISTISDPQLHGYPDACFVADMREYQFVRTEFHAPVSKACRE